MIRSKESKALAWTGVLKKRTQLYLTLLAIIISKSALYLLFARYRYQDMANDEAIMLAQSLEALLYPEHITELSGDVENLPKPEYVCG
jgi:hypothetical protein